MKKESKNKLKELFIGRDSSWLDFNKRVLTQVVSKNTPLMEKFKFLYITSNNLDEFMMVRLSMIKNKINSGYVNLTGMNALDEYDALLTASYQFKHEQERILKELYKVADKYFEISKFDELDTDEKNQVKKIFQRKVYPVLTPIAYDSTKEFPLLRSKEQCVVIEIFDIILGKTVISLVPIPKGISKLYKIKTSSDKIKFIKLEEIIKAYAGDIFVNKNIENIGTMRMLREAYVTLNEDTDVYLKERVRENIDSRETNKPILLEVNGLSKKCVKLLSRELDVDKHNIYKAKLTDYSFLNELPIINNKKLYYNEFNPVYPNYLFQKNDTVMDVLDENNDIVLHHPYDSYEPVIELLEEAATDNSVISIKQTLYRVSSVDSRIINALCDASRNGKDVAVLLELKARFDENQNLELIDKLKRCGCILTFGIEHLKTHCKFMSIVKRTNNGIKTYTHIGTGNYNDVTAKFYTDISYFTTSKQIGTSVITLFNMLSGFADVGNMPVEGLYYSPNNIRSGIYDCIDKEIKVATMKKEEGLIVIKVNSISDKEMIEKLYEASKNNVKVIIICRGVCSMKPINSNIVIKSVIGRYLEHSRIYYFRHKDKLFISSADLLTRNLDRRVEILCPIRAPKPKSDIKHILQTYLGIKDGDFIMNGKEYRYIQKDGSNQYHPQEIFMKEAGMRQKEIK